MSHHPLKWHHWVCVCTLVCKTTSYPRSCTPANRHEIILFSYTQNEGLQVKIRFRTTLKCTFFTVDLFDTSAVRSCSRGPILWGNIPTALSRIIPSPIFGFYKKNWSNIYKYHHHHNNNNNNISENLLEFFFLTISQKISAKLGAERTSQAASIRWEVCVSTPSLCQVHYKKKGNDHHSLYKCRCVKTVKSSFTCRLSSSKDVITNERRP